ncbi:MAG: hypothetical protein MK098_00445 [Marinovum sp.]|nr:hypothetical protein [Marinovum sp.]
MALMLTVVLWKKIQSIDFSIAREEGQISASVTFAMPVFLLLTVILFAFISFSHPIQVEWKSGNVAAGADAPTEVASGTNEFKVVGYSPSEDEQLQTALALNALTSVSRQLQQFAVQQTVDDELALHIERLARVDRALFSTKNQLAESGFTRNQITGCRADISSGAVLSPTCDRYKQMTKGELE